jgi:GntR family transcriptional regulator, transcriptional repressor for pyruvate dehydrogenase complex
MNNNLFEPVKAGRAGEDIALQIQAAILNGSIAPGDKLPSERDLQNIFKTGRGVVREALQVLKQKGLIEILKGSKGGAYIKNLDVDNISESFALFLKQNQTDSMDLIEFRESIDCIITDLAIARGTMDEKMNLVKKADQLAEAAKENGCSMEMLVELDKELNILFAKMTHNPIFEWIMRAVQLGFSSMDNELYEDLEYRTTAVINWQNTAGEIASSDPLKAKSYISYHYMILRQKLEQVKNGSLQMIITPIVTERS